MSRTSRLFLLLDALRAHRRPVTAAALAAELSVSVRTLYRDVQTLTALGAPIDGEAGLGYRLRTGFFLPPLMFAEDELEALLLGVRWVEQQGDPELATAAKSALAKIATATPRDLRDGLATTSLWAPVYGAQPTETALATVRRAIRSERKISLVYVDERDVRTERIVWPIALAFLDRKRLLAAWCELRGGFRHFRTERIAQSTLLQERYPERRRALMGRWEAQEQQERDGER